MYEHASRHLSAGYQALANYRETTSTSNAKRQRKGSRPASGLSRAGVETMTRATYAMTDVHIVKAFPEDRARATN